jgi:hypothetical protein
MTGFSATDAALEGFRITRERPKALLAWTAFSFLVSVASVLISVSMPAETRSALQNLQGADDLDATTLLEMLAVASPILIFGLIVQCVMAAGVYRIILRPTDEGILHYLRLGKDELRLAALTLIYIVLGMMMLAAVQIAILIVAVLASALGSGAMNFVGTVAEIFTLGVFAYVAVRMSLAPVITFDRQRLAILDSWAVTHGQFWRLLGTYLLAICCLIVVAMLMLVLFVAVSMIVMLAMGGSVSDLTKIFQPDETTLRSYLNPFMIAYMLVGSLFTAIYYAVIAAPGAVAYRELTKTA